MHRNKLLALLRGHQPSTIEEQRASRQTIQFVESNINCYNRENPGGHLTASAWIINRNNSDVLLTHHRKLNKWIQCGGHADDETDIAAVALREAREETGLKSLTSLSNKIFDVDVHTIPTYQNVTKHRHYDIRFLFSADQNEPLTVSTESIALAWIPLHNIDAHTTSPSILRMVIKSR